MNNRETLSKLIVFFSLLAILCFGLCANGVIDSIGRRPTYWRDFFVKAEAFTFCLSILGITATALRRSTLPPTDKDS